MFNRYYYDGGWYNAGWRDYFTAEKWYNAGWRNPRDAFRWYKCEGGHRWRADEALVWFDAGWGGADEAASWYLAGWRDANAALEWKNKGWKDEDAAEALEQYESPGHQKTKRSLRKNLTTFTKTEDDSEQSEYQNSIFDKAYKVYKDYKSDVRKSDCKLLNKYIIFMLLNKIPNNIINANNKAEIKKIDWSAFETKIKDEIGFILCQYSYRICKKLKAKGYLTSQLGDGWRNKQNFIDFARDIYERFPKTKNKSRARYLTGQWTQNLKYTAPQLENLGKQILKFVKEEM